MDIIIGIAGTTVGLIICIAVAMIALPIYGVFGFFINKPEGLKRSGIHFFTQLSPGQVKIIVRGKKIIRMVTNTSKKRFDRATKVVGSKKDDPAYWKLSDSQDAEDPTADIYWLYRWWAKIVYNTTGLVFTGFYPIQRVYEYELERTEIKRNEEGRQTNSNLVLSVKHDLSDHFRTRQFLYPMHITKAETKDKIPLDIIGVAEMEVVNPYQAAFGTDRWDQAVINLVTDKITSATKQMTLDQVLTAKNKSEARKINAAVEKIVDDEITCGIQITGFRILEINPALDEEGLKATQAEAIAIQQAKATRIDGQARADALRSLNEANQAGGEHAVASLEAEALVRAAEAAGKNGGTIILMPSGGKGSAATDATQAAILAELKKLNQKKK